MIFKNEQITKAKSLWSMCHLLLFWNRYRSYFDYFITKMSLNKKGRKVMNYKVLHLVEHYNFHINFNFYISLFVKIMIFLKNTKYTEKNGYPNPGWVPAYGRVFCVVAWYYSLCPFRIRRPPIRIQWAPIRVVPVSIPNEILLVFVSEKSSCFSICTLSNTHPPSCFHP